MKAPALAIILFLLSWGPGAAACQDMVPLFTNDNAKIIDTILAYGRCVQEEQKDRVGKWFCYVDQEVGVEKEGDAWKGGRFKPKPDKFFMTIKTMSMEDKKGRCGQAFGFDLNLGQKFGNHCAANFEVSFSTGFPVPLSLPPSPNAHLFGNEFGRLQFEDTNEFSLLTDFSNSYLRRGRCEKID